jgi:hypothetical protein
MGQPLTNHQIQTYAKNGKRGIVLGLQKSGLDMILNIVLAAIIVLTLCVYSAFAKANYHYPIANYSVLKFFNGFSIAATLYFKAHNDNCREHQGSKTTQLKSVLAAKSCSHLFSCPNMQ